MAFCAPDSMRSVETSRPQAAKQALNMFRSVVRTTVTACGGYECQEKDGIFMLAFTDPGDYSGWLLGGCRLFLLMRYAHEAAIRV
jgi:hypothetical protein